jgi:hypothetical protein
MKSKEELTSSLCTILQSTVNAKDGLVTAFMPAGRTHRRVDALSAEISERKTRYGGTPSTSFGPSKGHPKHETSQSG